MQRFVLLLTTAAFASSGCTPFVGLAPRDAAPDASEDAPARAIDSSAPCESSAQRCDAVTGAGCPSERDCRIVEYLPMRFDCGAFGARPEGAACSAESDCARGLHCLTPPSGVCVRLCCGGRPEGDARCASGGASNSRCSILSTSFVFNGCSGDDACDYRAQRGCSEGQTCAPSAPYGGARCFVAGPSAEGQPCTAVQDCAVGLTCRASGPGVPGACRPICNPQGTSTCEAGICQGFAQRPGDWGSCL